MSNSIPPIQRKQLPVALLVAIVAALTSCGLTIDNADRVARAERALAAEEYRAAIIDAKAVLLEEPDNTAARLVLGRSSVRSGDPASAEVELRRAIDLGVAPADVIVDLGRALLALGRHEAVIEEITLDLTTAEDDRRNVNLLRGRAHLGLGEGQEARNSFSKALVLEEADIEAQLGIASAYVLENNLQQARATLDFVIAANSGVIVAWLASADLAMQSRDLMRAQNDYGRALRLATQQEDQSVQLLSLRGLGNAVLAQNDLERARDVAAQMSVLAPDSLESKELTAKIAFIDEDWSLAQSNLQEILRQVPDYRPAQFLLGAAHVESGNLGQAEMYLSAVVAAMPDNTDARRYLAEARYRQEKSDAARETLQPLLEEDNPSTRSLGMAASASLDAGDFEHAAQYLQRAVAADPENSEAQMALAMAYVMAGNFEDAQQILDSVDTKSDELVHIRSGVLSVVSAFSQNNKEEALAGARQLKSDWPNHPIALNLAGAVELAEDNYSAARGNFESSLAIAPDNLMSLRYLAAVDEAEGKIDAARSRYRAITVERPDDVAAMVSIARLSAATEDYVSARSWLEKAIDADLAGSLKPRLLLGRMLLTNGDFEGAKRAADETLGEFADSAEAIVIKGYAQIGVGDATGAVGTFEKAIAIDSENIDFAIALARAHTVLGDKNEAARAIESAYSPETTSVPVAVLRATQFMDAGDSVGAMKIAKDLQRVLPDNALALVLEAEILAIDERLFESAQLYDRVLEIENSGQFAIRAYQIRTQTGAEERVKTLVSHLEERPLNHEVRLIHEQAYEVDGMGDMAIAEYEKVVETTPDNYVAANNLAWIYFTRNDPRAEEMARVAFAVAPENDSIMDTLGWILVNNGKAAEGVELLRSAVSNSGNRAEIRYHLAAGLVDIGNADEARIILNELVNTGEQFPAKKDAEELLRQL